MKKRGDNCQNIDIGLPDINISTSINYPESHTSNEATNKIFEDSDDIIDKVRSLYEKHMSIKSNSDKTESEIQDIAAKEISITNKKNKQK
ncbi:hypothetical protein CEXT_211841 [Caerostris extrusa]|uniref:Uncharacterized protein n=1 Tax=Caerostris extrusa TaxID=172846 RepID=A0AAV4PJI7_CAEEX|nr:hypothetical protein CEXT_211841 [Caerostris extrusa]